MSMPTTGELFNYLGIDYADEVVTYNVEKAAATARRTLLGAVGEDVEELLPDDERVEELIKIYTDDLYSERGVSAKVSGATRKLVQSMELQLKLELRQKREGASV